MDIFEKRFYKLNYRLLSFLGLWPYEKSRLSRVCIIHVIILSINMTQVTFDPSNKILKLCTSEGNFDVMKEVIPVWATSLNVVIKYYTFDLSVLDIIKLYDNSVETVKFIAFFIGELFHLFVASLSGQTIIDYSSEVYFKAYSGFWYESPMEVRKLLILIMRRSLEPSRLTAGDIFIYCLDGFATLLKLYTSNGNFDIMKEVIPIWATSFNVVIKYYLFDLYILDIKLLMDNMIIDWNMWKSKEEIDIMKKFAHSGRMYTLGYTSRIPKLVYFMLKNKKQKQIKKKEKRQKEKQNFLSFLFLVYIYVFMFLFLLVTFVPPLMDIIIPLNESRRLELPVLAEYCVDEQKHFYLIYFHMVVSIMIIITILIAIDTQLMVFCCHVSGAFAVVSFRLEHFLKNDATLDGLSDLQRKESYRHVSLSIKGHKRALELVLQKKEIIKLLYGKSIKAVKYIALVIGELFHLFVASLSGQTIIDYSSEVYFKAYSGLWYEAPIEIRKLLILIMRRSFKPSQLSAGKIFVYCLDGFSTVN
ncbi:uncharacterized protein LOC124431567 [Vespa crabro]|uniref:uncharacterized protein LOC124431567 n=1 Tax=Vespa crabro TaxID=7445 RepID=UPI001F02F9B6|nr:uncharacterized protein LOC124431567 [Vespa crabro]